MADASRVMAEMPPEHMEEIKDLLLQKLATSRQASGLSRERIPAPALYPHNPSIHRWPVTIPLSTDTQHQGLCVKSSSEVSQTRQRDKLGQFSLLWESQPSTPVHTQASPSPVTLCDHLGEVGLFSDSPCLVPPLSSDHFTCLGRVIPVA